MAEKERGKATRPQTTPEDYPVSASHSLYPSGDFSYILEIVMGMQKSMGGLEQAVKTLTEESAGSRKKLDRISHIICGGRCGHSRNRYSCVVGQQGHRCFYREPETLKHGLLLAAMTTAPAKNGQPHAGALGRSRGLPRS